VYVLDRPGALQSVIIAGHVAPPKANPDELAIETMNTILGGEFTARINMNLREDKHWSYGAQSLVWDAEGQRPFLVFAPVQSDKTAESMREIQAELTGIRGQHPATAEELARVKNSMTLTLPGRWETNGAVLGSLADIVRYGLPETYWSAYAGNVRDMNLQKVNAAARAVIHPESLVWVVVGDRAKIAESVAALGFGEVQEIDADGNVKN
jgi:zinc protease